MITHVTVSVELLLIGEAAFLACLGLLTWRLSRRRHQLPSGPALLVGLPGIYLATLPSFYHAPVWLDIPALVLSSRLTSYKSLSGVGNESTALPVRLTWTVPSSPDAPQPPVEAVGTRPLFPHPGRPSARRQYGRDHRRTRTDQPGERSGYGCHGALTWRPWQPYRQPRKIRLTLRLACAGTGGHTFNVFTASLLLGDSKSRPEARLLPRVPLSKVQGTAPGR